MADWCDLRTDTQVTNIPVMALCQGRKNMLNIEKDKGTRHLKTGHYISGMIIILSFIFLIQPVSGESDESRLIHDLLVNYSTDSRPVINSSHAINVNISLTLAQILKLDEKSEVFSGVIWIEQRWMDQHLGWDPSKYGGLGSVYIGADKIWTPDIYLKNLVGESFNMAAMFLGLTRELSFVQHTGNVSNYLPVKVETTCSVNLWTFPFDSQTCDFILGSWVYPEKYLSLQLVDKPKSEVTNGSWEYINLTSKKSDPKTYFGFNYCTVEFHLTIKRNPLFYLLNLIIPSYLMSGVMLLSLFLPPESGERMSVGLTVFMTYSVFTLLMSSIMPDSARSPPIICSVLIVNMVLSLLINAWTVIVIRIHNFAANLGPPPKALKTFTNTFTKLPCMKFNRGKYELRRHKDQEHEQDKREITKDITVKSDSKAGKVSNEEECLKDWASFTKTGDMLLALLYFIFIIIGIIVLIIIAQ